MILLTDRVREYIRNASGRNNEFFCPHTKDHCGRLLSPLDTVIATMLTDEGGEVLLKGMVRGIDDFNQLVKVEPDANFKDFGFETEWVAGDKVIRFPNGNPVLAHELVVFCGSINSSVHAGKVLYKNGKRVQFHA